MISDILSIKIMANIFKESNFKLSHSSMQLYQNILHYHFCDKEEKIISLLEFNLKHTQIPNYEKFEKRFLELQNANLIKINKSTILFKNVWQIHLNLARMLAPINYNKSATEYFEVMKDSQQLIEIVAMKLKVKKEEVVQLLNTFIDEQNAIVKLYPNETECRKHFIYWSQFNQSKITKNQVISNAKILGIK